LYKPILLKVILFHVCKKQEEAGIGCPPDSFELAFLLKSSIFVTNIEIKKN